MKCSKCGGDGVISLSKTDKNGYLNDAFFVKECPVCHGTGEVQSNEEWFSTLTTEGKAEVIAQLSSYGGNVEAILGWLKEKHGGSV